MVTVPFDGYFEEDGVRFLVMQRLGDTLKEKLKQQDFTDGDIAMVATQIVRLFADVAHATTSFSHPFRNW